MSEGVRFGVVRYGVLAGMEGILRYSTIVRKLREQGATLEALAEFSRDRKEYGSICPTHGALTDPVVGLVGEPGDQRRVAFGCPWCSGSGVLEAWEQEGRSA